MAVTSKIPDDKVVRTYNLPLRQAFKNNDSTLQRHGQRVDVFLKCLAQYGYANILCRQRVSIAIRLLAYHLMDNCDTLDPFDIGFDLNNMNQWQSLGHFNISSFWVEGKIGQCLSDLLMPYHSFFAVSSSMSPSTGRSRDSSKFLSMQRVTNQSVKEFQVNVTNMIDATHEQRNKKMIKAYLLANHLPDNVKNRRIIHDLIYGCVNNRYSVEILNTLGVYRFIQPSEYNVPQIRGQSESPLEKFVWDAKAVLFSHAIKIRNHSGRIDDVWVNMNRVILLRYSVYCLRYVESYNHCHPDKPVKTWDITPKCSDKFPSIMVDSSLLFICATYAKIFDPSIKVKVGVKNQTIGHKNMHPTGFIHLLYYIMFHWNIQDIKRNKLEMARGSPNESWQFSSANAIDLPYIIKASNENIPGENWVSVNGVDVRLHKNGVDGTYFNSTNPRPNAILSDSPRVTNLGSFRTDLVTINSLVLADKDTSYDPGEGTFNEPDATEKIGPRHGYEKLKAEMRELVNAGCPDRPDKQYAIDGESERDRNKRKKKNRMKQMKYKKRLEKYNQAVGKHRYF